MLWAKVSGHPWWPCIILPDPEQTVWSKPVQSMIFIFYPFVARKLHGI